MQKNIFAPQNGIFHHMNVALQRTGLEEPISPKGTEIGLRSLDSVSGSIRRTDIPEGDGNSNLTAIYQKHEIIRRTDIPEGDGNSPVLAAWLPVND